MKTFKDKVVVITGAGSGIGRALAKEFHEKGARLALNDFNADTLKETVAFVGGQEKVFSRVFDVSKKDDFYQFAEDIISHYGHVDIVINNAGVAIAKRSTAEMSIEDYEWIMGINLWGMMYGTLAFLPHLRKRKESSVVNVSSIFGVHGIPYQSGYSTTKFGIRGFTETLALEERLEGTGVVATSVHPGGIKTNIAKKSRYVEEAGDTLEKFEKAFITTPEKAASTIIKGIQKKKIRVVIGRDGKMFFFLSRLPRYFILKLLLKFGREARPDLIEKGTL